MDEKPKTNQTEPQFRCKYCGQMRPMSELERVEVYTNGERKPGLYCKDKGCAAYAEMSSEG